MECLHASVWADLMSYAAVVLNALSRIRNLASNTVTVGEGSRLYRWRVAARAGNRLIVGKHSIVQCWIGFDAAQGTVTVGDRSYIGASHIVCHSSVTIGADVIISWGVTIVDHDSHSIHWHLRKADIEQWHQGRKSWEHVPVRPVVILDRVWIGFGASILKGVTIGEGAVIGACSVVTRDVPPYTVVAGNPARVVRQLAPA